MIAILLAAGRGKRMGKLTESKPKGLLNCNGRPIIDYAMTAILKGKPKHIYIVIGYLGSQIETYLDRKLSCVNVKYSFINQTLLDGTASAVEECIKVAPSVVNEELVCISAVDYIVDSYLIENLIEIKNITNSDIVLTTRKIPIKSVKMKNHVEIDSIGQVTKLTEKPNAEYSNAEVYSSRLIYCLSGKVLNLLHKIPFSCREERELPELINLAISNGFVVSSLEDNLTRDL